MTTLDELLHEHASLTTVRVERWVARGLLRPGGTGDTWVFATVAVARTHLLAELTGAEAFHLSHRGVRHGMVELMLGPSGEHL